MEATANQQTQRPLPTPGQHLALLYSIVDLGTQDGSYNGQPTAPVRKIQLGWELPGQKAVFSPEKGEQPMAIFQEYTFSLGDKANFRKMMDSWIGQPVTKLNTETLNKLLGKPCMIMIEHKASKKDPKIKYANIAFKGIAVFKRPADVPFPKATINEKLYFDIDHFSWETFNKVTKFLQDKIRKCHEWPSIIAKHPEVAQPAAGAIQDDSEVVMGGIEEEDPFN